MVKWVNFAFRNLLILRLTVLASKFYFFQVLEHYSFKMFFFCHLPIFCLKPSPSMYFVYLSGVRCFWPSSNKDSSSCSSSSSPSSPVRLSGICCTSSLGVPSCAVVSLGVVGCFGQYWLLLFFFTFWLMLETASPRLGQSYLSLMLSSSSFTCRR